MVEMKVMFDLQLRELLDIPIEDLEFVEIDSSDICICRRKDEIGLNKTRQVFFKKIQFNGHPVLSKYLLPSPLLSGDISNIKHLIRLEYQAVSSPTIFDKQKELLE
ncbi:hypothetical protein [Psychrobacillus sp. FSL H8-0510]|uniref:hypothetical protein n=1 Tax=Psychrobacillus sp. FSL H8-0510 TaxID=2921394 RepID=UPI0030F7F6FB